MNYSKIDPMSIVDGEGCRVTLFVSGCRNQCKGCFNPETWNFDYGQTFDVIALNEIIEACKKPYISGLTILGGEPFEVENQPAIADLIREFKAVLPEKNIWVFTGYIYEKNLRMGQSQYLVGITDYILENTDILVDGPFILEQRDLNLKFCGSRNQRLLSKDDRAKL
jgi:anaerobic ribonucleoside-triphosphate reductase activating protein